jgi:glycosyltransferase involved in cell wall biosynthesis
MAVRKILHVIPSVGTLRGGPSVMVRTLACGLSRMGLETHIATTNDNGPERLQVPLGVPIVKEGVTYWYFPRQIRFYTFSWPLSAWLARHVQEFDLVHIHALFSFATLAAAFWARRHGVPYIVRPLGTLNEWGMRNRRPWLKRMSFRVLENRILKHAALVHYTSEQERTEAGKLQVTTASEIIPNALPEHTHSCIPGQFRLRHPELEGRRIILFLSRLDTKKGLDLLLPAFAQVRTKLPDVSLVLAGNGSPEFVSRLKEEAVSLGVESDVLWTGFLAGDDKYAALADAELFVLPSHSENFGIAVVEAMAAGTPVIVSDQVGIHREIAAAMAGLVVSCDVTRLADSLLQLLNHPAESRSMGLNGKRLAQKNYSSEAVTRKLVEAYNGVAN